MTVQYALFTKREMDDKTALAVGQHLKMAQNGFGKFMVDNYDDIKNATINNSVCSGIANLASTASTTYPTPPCLVDMNYLITNNILPMGSNSNPYGSAYTLSIYKVNQNDIEGLVVTNDVWKNESATPSYTLIGKAVEYAGLDFGMVPMGLTTTISGYKGGWMLNSSGSKNPEANESGALVARITNTSSVWDKFVKKSGDDMTGWTKDATAGLCSHT